jgi:hypothetical protein
MEISAERFSQGEHITKWDDMMDSNKHLLSLILVTARVLRAHLRDSLDIPYLPREMLSDIEALDKALAPFDGKNGSPINKALLTDIESLNRVLALFDGNEAKG